MSLPTPFLLIAEDERTIRELAWGILEDNGWRVATADDGQTALDWFDEHRPDLVLLDMSLPHVDGVGVATGLRQRYECLPAVLMTADGHVAQKASSACTRFYLKKPFEIQELADVVELALQEGLDTTSGIIA